MLLIKKKPPPIHGAGTTAQANQVAAYSRVIYGLPTLQTFQFLVVK
jgi:hypothetical protein